MKVSLIRGQEMVEEEQHEQVVMQIVKQAQ